MKVADVPAVRAIEIASFPNPWSDGTFRGEIQNTSISFPLVVVDPAGGDIIGYIIYWHIRDDVQINSIAVRPDLRGKGIGEAVLRHVMDDVRKKGASFISLEVRQSNVRAQALYQKLGFKIIGVRKGYYTKPDEDALVMGMTLGRAPQ